MNRIDKILHHPVYNDLLNRLQLLEANRIYCRHDMPHFLDVARLMWIEALEKKLPVEREIVYAAALLHDIGRVEQAEHGTPHEQASANLAGQILLEAGYNGDEICEITAAILSHRKGCTENTLGQILYQADKRSRACWSCGASCSCNWPEEKKNKGIFR